MNILVTGANRGLGLSFIKLGVEKGYKMIAGIRGDKGKHEDLLKVQAEYPDLVEIVNIDVSDEESIRQAKRVLEKLDLELDGLINNAGVLVDRGKKFDELDLDEGLLTFDINTFGPIRVVKHMHALLKGEDSFIVNISSDAGSIANTYDGDYFYGMSKSALNMFSEKLNRALKGVRVYSVHPGWLHTDMGGGQAPMSPDESATCIYHLVEGKVETDPSHTYMNYKGEKFDF
ncbi:MULTISPECIES: SDR family NAD(P)-dependent oxidoreductase [Bacillaceae]|uniref:SDR family NAD(P)-dependent oxidoreductase n=1 Tax=Evansella alkalicola TaxID=745819 RepID=A0ABS6JXR8_9BACI|nr:MULTISPECIES: SDR family NAD(P)-dependent oxidoreductase [Bacillaceae]MBU9723379.1 SDR family NAD(P)-dependent oxidoreductase [Bacillus alkalicola]